MIRSPRPRTNLTDSLQRQLNMYALAAGAAGVGVLALTQGAEAKIVYTPANISLGFDQVTPLDLNMMESQISISTPSMATAVPAAKTVSLWIRGSAKTP